MMKSLLLFVTLLPIFAIAQNKKIALLETLNGDKAIQVKGIEMNMVRGELRKAISNQEGCQAFTRTDIDQLMKEHGFQNSGMVSDAQRKKMGEMSGADYICVSTLTKSESQFYLEAYLIEVETGEISNPASQFGVLQDGTYSNLFQLCQNLAKELFSGVGNEPSDTHDYVDLGLPSRTLWATCNVGATKPEEYGDYFAWGETTGYNGGKTMFNWSTYKYCKGSNTTMTKYCASSDYGTVDNKTELDPADVAAPVNWGSNWQMPSLAQFKELINSSYTTTTWTTQNGVYGRKITSKSNGMSIFLPAAGYRNEASLYNTGSFGDYWSRSLYASDSRGAYYQSFYSGNIGAGYGSHYYGRSVRPVRVQK